MSTRIRSAWTSRVLRLRPTMRSSSTPSRPTLRLESYDGYLIAPLQSEAVATAIANTDKPVVAYDTRIDSDKCLAFVGTGNKGSSQGRGGKAAVEAAKAAGWTDIKCIEIAGVQGDATNTARMEGYREGVNEAGGEFLDAETQYANATADLAVTAMEGIMSKYPEGVAIICSNNDDMALAAARTAKDNPELCKTIFLGFDGQKSAVEAVLNGELTMTAAQNNFDIGYKAVETIVKILNGEEYGDVDTGTEIITKDNAQARLDNFANWLNNSLEMHAFQGDRNTAALPRMIRTKISASHSGTPIFLLVKNADTCSAFW